jgi:hypothetical protein
MNLLDAIPEIGKILDDLVSTPDEKRAAELRLREIDIREVEARLGVQRAWLSNQSIFVAGAIPTVLWMVSVVIFFNHVLAPLLRPLVTIPTLDLPAWYANLAGTIVLGLFGKKAWDSSEIHWGGEIVKPAKEKIRAEIDKPEVCEVSLAQASSTPPSAPIAPKTPAPQPEGKSKSKPRTSEEVDARLREICKEKGIEP